MKKLFILLVLLLPLIIILGSARLVVFDKSLHESLFIKSETVIENYNLLNDDVVEFLKGNTETVESDMFTDKEKDHLRDVRWLINVLSAVFYSAIVLFVILLFYFYNEDKLIIRKGLFYGGVLTFSLLGVGALLFSINFDFMFSLFHKLFFPQGNYVFRTNLPLLYNGVWYYLISFRIVLYSVIGAGVLVVQKFVKRL
ncbi:MAG: DUF1461 domain-containing protein [Nanoarchaeota archaeon]|nr:DUF1461 domain-containing protein [Nanoarchaeota archaeon]